MSLQSRTRGSTLPLLPELPVGFLDGEIVDAGVPAFHVAEVVEFPVPFPYERYHWPAASCYSYSKRIWLPLRDGFFDHIEQRAASQSRGRRTSQDVRHRLATREHALLEPGD